MNLVWLNVTLNKDQRMILYADSSIDGMLNLSDGKMFNLLLSYKCVRVVSLAL
jgi:hypothetical protein